MSAPAVSTTQNPFLTVTTPAMERARRLIAVQTHPGFNEILRLSLELVKEAQEAVDTYPGWDKDQMFTLFTRAQVARQHHRALLAKIQMAIEEGEAEARVLIQDAAIPEVSMQEVLEQSDALRARVLTSFQEADNRAAGSFNPDGYNEQI